MSPSYFLIPLIGGVIGWGTNVVAIRMLFRPRRAFKIGWFRFQGVIPSRKAALAGSFAELFEKEFLSNKELQEHLNGVDLGAHLDPVIDQRVGGFFDRFVEQNSMIKMFVSPAMKESIVDEIKTELLKAAPELKMALSQSLGSRVDLRALVEQKVHSFSLSRLEEIIVSVAKKELKAVEWWGAALGVLIGVIQVAIIQLI